jgi:competence protein ComEA
MAKGAACGPQPYPFLINIQSAFTVARPSSLEYKRNVSNWFGHHRWNFRSAAICGVALWFCAASTTVKAQSLKLPDGPGKATTQKVCGSCHGAELVIGRQENKETWGAIVEDMIQRGATGTEDEFFEVVDYLGTHFSKTSPVIKINVNKATAKDLENALRIPGKQAAAIVQQREEKGDFKSVDDLKKVPGVDVSRIEASKNRLAF